jgi:hypothetical protein
MEAAPAVRQTMGVENYGPLRRCSFRPRQSSRAQMLPRAGRSWTHTSPGKSFSHGGFGARQFLVGHSAKVGLAFGSGQRPAIPVHPANEPEAESKTRGCGDWVQGIGAST